MTNPIAMKDEPRHHVVKCVQPFFDQIWSRKKPFEIRLNDRNYTPGDTITQREFVDGEYTGREVTARIGFMTPFQQMPGYVVFALEFDTLSAPFDYEAWIRGHSRPGKIEVEDSLLGGGDRWEEADELITGNDLRTLLSSLSLNQAGADNTQLVERLQITRKHLVSGMRLGGNDLCTIDAAISALQSRPLPPQSPKAESGRPACPGDGCKGCAGCHAPADQQAGEQEKKV